MPRSPAYPEAVDVEFNGEVFCWRGPAPYYFVAVPEPECQQIHEVAAMVTYGWGMIPVDVRVGDTEWATSLWPKDGGYVLPLKLKVRTAEGLDEGDVAVVHLTIGG